MIFSLAVAVSAVTATRTPLPGVYTNEEQVEFARASGQPELPWMGIEVRKDLDRPRLARVDAFGETIAGEPGNLQSTGSDGLVLQMADGTMLKLLRARMWRCWAAIPKAGGGWWMRRDIPLHDRGGRALVETNEAVPQRFVLRMRNVVFPEPPNQPSIVLYVHGTDPVKAVIYAWAEPGARRLGINLRSIQASCSLEE